ncbi:ABC transporter permease subunit [Hydrogenoanaerobacterium sp.]|uniref:galactose/methyl galactoside ABC transporter permease MglC n=1 Tax=Hydrogenoanaerobacterium sp. TaxID=2953763 RepID=UPI00289EEA2B|nr:beta-methylgalactoside transporter [Hydrogenoanaerobacterium sp.]
MDATEKKVYNRKKVIAFLENNAITILMIGVAVVVGILRPNFISGANFSNLSVNTAVRFIIALGVSGCLITKGTDLSAGRVVGLGACIAATLLQKPDYSDRFFPNLPDLPIPVVLVIVLAICALIGIINGSVISFLKVPPFIATLGMQTLVYGICLVYTGAKPIGGLKSNYTAIASGKLLNLKFLPYLLIIAAVCGCFMWFLYNKTRHGKYMYAIGGNENAAEVAGVNTSKTKILIYMLAAILYGLAGFLLAAKSGGTSVNMGAGYELEAIAACTIGGVSTNGGVGRVSGILIGVLVFELLKISLQFMGVETSYTYIVQGLVIIIAVALDLRKYLAKK